MVSPAEKPPGRRTAVFPSAGQSGLAFQTQEVTTVRTAQPSQGHELFCLERIPGHPLLSKKRINRSDLAQLDEVDRILLDRRQE